MINSQENENALTPLRERLKSKFGYIPEADTLIQKARDLRHKTTILIQFVEDCKKEIFNKIGEGANSINGMVQKPHTMKGLYELMTNTTQKYNAEKLKTALDEHITYLNQSFEGFFSDPFLSLTDTPQKMDFAMYHFSNTSVIIALSMLTNFQLDILRYEDRCVQKLTPTNESRGFDWIVPLVEAESKKVQEGDEYVAHIYLGQRLSAQGMRIFVNGMPILINSRGEGEVRWKVTGKGKQTWKGEIKTKYYGRDTTFVVYPTYEVIPRTK